MDHIFIRELKLEARIGFHKRERVAPQAVLLDLEIGIADAKVFDSDRVADCIDYDVAVGRIREICGEQHYNLVEVLAERVARMLLDEFGASYAKVSVAKPGIMKAAGLVGVTVERTKAKKR